MKTVRFIALILGVLLLPGSSAETRADASGWTGFRGPEGQGKAPQADPPLVWSETENVRWKTALPGKGASSPVVWEDRIYLTSADDGAGSGLQRHLLCLDARTGEILWNTSTPAVLPEQETIREDHGYASGTPAVDAAAIYVHYGKSGVFAFNHRGEQLWQCDVGDGIHGWGSANSPTLYEHLVLINASVESESLFGIDRGSGEVVWRLSGMRESWNTPVLVPQTEGSPECVVGVLGKVLGIHPGSGELLWECANDIKWYICPSIVRHEGVAYSMGGRTGEMIAVRTGGQGDVTSTRRLWKLNKGSNVSSPIYHEGHLYFAHENLGIAYCVEAGSGRLVYEERIRPSPGQIYASPVLCGDRLYYVSRGGLTTVVSAKPVFEVLGQNRLDRDAGTFNASPAVWNSDLLLRSDRYLFCIGQP